MLIANSPALANDSSVGRNPEGIYPITETDVIMLSEDIVIDVEKGLVSCDFVFKNTSGAKNILMGFPARMKTYDEAPDGDPEVHDFKCWIDDKLVATKLEKGVAPTKLPVEITENYTHWYTFSVPFARNATVRVKNTYRVTNTYYSTGEILTSYIMKTGAVWKDSIGHAKITFLLGEIKPYELQMIFPSNMVFKDNALVLERENISPTYNPTIMYNKQIYTGDFLSHFPLDFQKAHLAKKGYFLSKSTTAKNASVGKIQDLYRQALRDKEYVTAQYLNSLLPDSLRNSNNKPEKPLISSDNKGGFTANYVDKDGDLTNGYIVAYFFDKGRKVIAFEDKFDLMYFDDLTSRKFAFAIDMRPNTRYYVSTIVYDSYGNSANNSISYLSPMK
jgi:hypothetical protein